MNHALKIFWLLSFLFLMPQFVIADDDDDDDDGDEIEIEIDKAKYSANTGRLTVKGEIDDDDNAFVELFDADLNALLGAQNADDEDFKFKIADFGVNSAPCRVRVAAGGESVTKTVKKAPANCSQPAVTIVGVVRDDPIPFATVTVTVGDQVFTTVADASGLFAIGISSPDPESMVVIESTAPNPLDPTKTVNLASIVGNYQTLLDDEDQTITGEENPNVDNNPFTTAGYVLVAQANGGEVPTTQEELDATQTSIDATTLIEMAAVIKLIVDNPGEFELPVDPATGEQFTSIVAFLATRQRMRPGRRNSSSLSMRIRVTSRRLWRLSSTMPG